jgi:uncharacterized secreted protein with C-terminal beta-propeller domain
MSLSIVSAIAAHKLAAALILGSLAISGGAAAASANANHQANTVGEMSFTINPAFNVTTLASLDLGTLSTGQTGTVSSSSTINFTSAGNYSLSLVDIGVLHAVFSSFNVTVTGLGAQDNLSLSQPTQMINISSTGIYTAQITLTYTVRNTNPFVHGVTVTNAPFLQLFSGQVPPGVLHHWHHHPLQDNDTN